MSGRITTSPLEQTIAALQAWFEAERIPGLFIGGIAVSLVGRPRTTKDVDAVVWLPDHARWGTFVRAGERHGIVPRIPDPLGFALGARVLLLRHAPSGVDVDVSLGALPFEETAIRRAKVGRIGKLRIPIPTPEDLVVMKAIAHRPRDMSDIETVLDAHPSLDAREVMTTVQAFADALEQPEIADDLAKMLSGVEKRRGAARMPPRKQGRRDPAASPKAGAKGRTRKR